MSRYGIVMHSELAHHGIKGQKWGVRRYQNSDGTLTSAGKERYGGKSSTKGFTKVESRNKDYDNYSKKLSNGTTILFSKKKSDNNSNVFNYAKDFENNYSKIKKECDNSIVPVMKKYNLDNKTISKLLTKMNNATVNDDGIIYIGYDTTGMGLPFGNNSFNIDYNIIKKRVENAGLGD